MLRRWRWISQRRFSKWRVRTARAAIDLRENVIDGLGPEEAAGLQMFLDYAADLGLAPRRRPLEFFDQ